VIIVHSYILAVFDTSLWPIASVVQAWGLNDAGEEPEKSIVYKRLNVSLVATIGGLIWHRNCCRIGKSVAHKAAGIS
jgi:hypothetical protein